MTRTKQWTYISPSYLLYWIFSFYFINFNFFKSKPNFSFSSSPVVSLISTQNYYTIQQKNTKNTHSQKSQTHYFLLLKKTEQKKYSKAVTIVYNPSPLEKKPIGSSFLWLLWFRFITIQTHHHILCLHDPSLYCPDLVTWLRDGGRRRGRLLPRAKSNHSRFQCGKLQVKFITNQQKQQQQAERMLDFFFQKKQTKKINEKTKPEKECKKNKSLLIKTNPFHPLFKWHRHHQKPHIFLLLLKH